MILPIYLMVKPEVTLTLTLRKKVKSLLNVIMMLQKKMCIWTKIYRTMKFWKLWTI